MLRSSSTRAMVGMPRLTVIGRARKVEGETRERVRRRFLARHPKSALYADFPDFSFWRLDILGAHLNGGFARAADFEAAALVTPLDGAAALLEAEGGALAHLNEDHADALRLYATRLAGEPDGAWKAVGLDPEGLDLARGDLSARIAFPRRISGPAELRAILVELAREARAQSAEKA
jgi:putative heme iron utilization protein